MERLINVLAVCAGSAIGGGARYLVSVWANARGLTKFPWATLIVNVVGCFLIALILTLGTVLTIRTNVRLFLTTGIMGGLTTYSAFNYEATQYVRDGAPMTALVNVVATLVVCCVAG